MSECSQCGAQMQEGQDWCLQCGAPHPKSLTGGGPGWRTGAAILGATALLVVGASVAAYAALNKTKHKPARVAVALRMPTTVVPPTTVPGTIPPPATTTPGTPTTVSPTPPKIPTQTPTPSTPSEPTPPPETTKTTETTSTTKAGESTKSSQESGSEGSETKSGSGAEPPSPILLDTNAASTYNPYSYSASLFGDPSLAIDGEAKTAWTAQVQAEKAPNMAEGLVLDLKSPQKLGSATVKTTTTGVTVEVYGTNGKALPASITEPAWKRLVGRKVLKKKTTAFTLKTKGKAYRYIVLWLAKAPASSTAAAPGTVSINEFELFPPKT